MCGIAEDVVSNIISDVAAEDVGVRLARAL
jgi:hypothetical protein